MKSISLKAREEALARLGEIEKSLEGMVVFYEYGTFSNPGLSDLDLVCEISDDFRYIRGFGKETLPCEVVEVMAHASLICVPQGMIHSLHLWDDVRLRRIDGSYEIFDAYSGNKMREIAMFIDFYYERRHRLLGYKRDISALRDMRQGLGFCKSYCYSIKGLIGFDAKELGDSLEKDARRLMGEISSKREEGQRGGESLYGTLFRECCDLIDTFEQEYGEKIDRVIDRLVFNQLEMEEEDYDIEIEIPGGPSFYAGEREYTSSSAVRIARGAAVQLALYGSFGMDLSERLRACMKIGGEKCFEAKGRYRDYLFSRFEAADKWHSFARMTGHRCGIYKYGWLR